MKTAVLLLIIRILVYQGLCEEIALRLSSCSKGSNGTIKWIRINDHSEEKFNLKLEFCSFNSICYESEEVTGMTFIRVNEDNHAQCKKCNNFNNCDSCNISHILETFDKCTCSQQPPTSSQDSTITCAMSTKLTQDILIALLAILAALLLIVTTGWVCTCWAMHKNRRQEMNINTTNIRYSEMQATNGNNTTIQPSCSQVHNNNPNRMSLRQNQAYGAGPEKTSPDPNTDREYEVIPPLVDGKTRLNNAESNDYRETPNVQRREEISHQQTAPRQPQEEEGGEGSRMQSGQVMMENSEYKDLQIGNENVYHILEPKAEDDEDNTAPYEVPVLTKTKN